jgi:DNA polymerase-3 subunit epsilon
MTIREIILDTETTGLDPRSGHRVVEVGALEMINKVITGNKFHYYINPERDMPLEAYRIHGISTSFLKDKPLFKDVASEFVEFIQGGKLVIHNAPFDLKFLNHELSLLNLPSIEIAEVIDTLPIARRIFPGSRANLDALCKRFKIDNTNREFHGALKDAYLLAEVYVELSGGRQVSFSLQGKNNNNVEMVQEAMNHQVKGNGVVIVPTAEEMQKHEGFMERVRG